MREHICCLNVVDVFPGKAIHHRLLLGGTVPARGAEFYPRRNTKDILIYVLLMGKLHSLEIGKFPVTSQQIDLGLATRGRSCLISIQ